MPNHFLELTTQSRGAHVSKRCVPRGVALNMLMLAGCLNAVGCGAGNNGGFSLLFPDNRPGEIRQVERAVANTPTEKITPFVVLIPPPPAHGLTVFSLPDGARRWQTGMAIDVRPMLAGGLTISHTAGQIVGWSTRDGTEKIRLGDQGYTLIGAGGDSRAVALSLGPGGLNRRRGTLFVVDPSSGHTMLERSTDQPLGIPTAAGGYAFVPWSGQNLSVFELSSGAEFTRIRTEDDVFNRIEREGNALFYGAKAIYRLSAESAQGTREAVHPYALPRTDLPGSPPLFNDGYSPVAIGINARERVSVVTRQDPDTNGTTLVDGLFYGLFHSTVFAFEATTGNVRWAYAHEQDIAASRAVRGGLVAVDDKGTVFLIDATSGQPVWQQDLGAATVQAVLDLPVDFSPQRNVEGTAPSLAQGLIHAAGGSDNRVLPARVFAAKVLGSVPGSEATQGLMEIAGRRSYPEELRRAAGEALAQRTEGLDVLLTALSTHYDFLRDTQTPPVGYIARAFAAAHDDRAVPALVSHLSDPETPAADLLPLVNSLRALKATGAVPALLDFVRTYHADIGLVPPIPDGDLVSDRSESDQEALNQAVVAAIGALSELGGPHERRWIEALTHDANTDGATRNALLSGLEPATTTDTSGNTDTTATPTSDAGTTHTYGPPMFLSQSDIDSSFSAIRDDLLKCIPGQRPSQVRVQFRYDTTGTVSTVVVMPAIYTPCMTPITQGVFLPVSQVRSEIGTYYLVGGH